MKWKAFKNQSFKDKNLVILKVCKCKKKEDLRMKMKNLKNLLIFIGMRKMRVKLVRKKNLNKRVHQMSSRIKCKHNIHRNLLMMNLMS